MKIFPQYDLAQFDTYGAICQPKDELTMKIVFSECH